MLRSAQEVPSDSFEVLEVRPRLGARVEEREVGQLGPSVAKGGDVLRRACEGAQPVTGGARSLTSAVESCLESLNGAKGCGKGEKDEPRRTEGGNRRQEREGSRTLCISDALIQFTLRRLLFSLGFFSVDAFENGQLGLAAVKDPEKKRRRP